MKIFKSANLLFLVILISIFSCAPEKKISGKFIEIQFDDQTHSRVINKYNESQQQGNTFQPSEFVLIEGKTIKDFSLSGSKSEPLNDAIGSGIKLMITGKYQDDNLHIEKNAGFRYYDAFPDMVLTNVTYTNKGDQAVSLSGWVNHNYMLSADKSATEPAFWSYQSGSYESRPDWVLPLTKGFEQQNYMGMNASDYGGGTPVVDIWTKDGGISVGHVEMVVKLVSLPVSRDSLTGDSRLSIQYISDRELKPGEAVSTFTTFVGVHKGDYFHSFTEYSRFMQNKGITFQPFPATAYEPVWCAWGYERKFNVKEVLGTLPKVKELGFKWAVLDDGWQTAEGDWYLDATKFPRGDRDMKAFVDKIHSYDLKAKLWWAPLAVDPGTDLIKNHADLLLLNKDGSTQDISWWDSYYLCPAYKGTLEHTKELVRKIMGEWGYDGLKIDGQHLNAAPPCYNPEHHHAYPEQSVEGIATFFKMIYETALEINPDAVVEICPCGTAYAFHTMPYMNQPVSSDPTSSWQIRSKGKTFKALMGPETPYYGDHVELSDHGTDFASSFGIGAVLGTKFTWPTDRLRHKRYVLTKEKETLWARWMTLYEQYELPKGEYLGDLYDIGFDKPETHAIRKDGAMYYAFYGKNFDGRVVFRGLPAEEKEFVVSDIINNRELGVIRIGDPGMNVEFNNFLILQVKVKQ